MLRERRGCCGSRRNRSFDARTCTVNSIASLLLRLLSLSRGRCRTILGITGWMIGASVSRRRGGLPSARRSREPAKGLLISSRPRIQETNGPITTVVCAVVALLRKAPTAEPSLRSSVPFFPSCLPWIVAGIKKTLHTQAGTTDLRRCYGKASRNGGTGTVISCILRRSGPPVRNRTGKHAAPTHASRRIGERGDGSLVLFALCTGPT
jgi:hypothetical protein